jgi:hypothetical protein
LRYEVRGGGAKLEGNCDDDGGAEIDLRLTGHLALTGDDLVLKSALMGAPGCSKKLAGGHSPPGEKSARPALRLI